MSVNYSHDTTIEFDSLKRTDLENIKNIKKSFKEDGVPAKIDFDEQFHGDVNSAKDQFHAAGQNAAAIIADEANVFYDVVNVFVGGGQTLYGTGQCIWDGIKNVMWKLDKDELRAHIDGNFDKLMESGELTNMNDDHVKGLQADRLKLANEALRQMNEEHYPLFKEGLQRVMAGSSLAVYDLVSIPKDAADAICEFAAACGLTVGQAAEDSTKYVAMKMYNGYRAVDEFVIETSTAFEESIIHSYQMAELYMKKDWEQTKNDFHDVVDAVDETAEATADAFVDTMAAIGDALVADYRQTIKDVKFVGHKIGEGIHWVSDEVREGYEDSMAAIASKAAKEANRVANVAPRFELSELPDFDANYKEV